MFVFYVCSLFYHAPKTVLRVLGLQPNVFYISFYQCFQLTMYWVAFVNFVIKNYDDDDDDDDIMAVFWLSYWQIDLRMQRKHASTLSVEIG